MTKFITAAALALTASVATVASANTSYFSQNDILQENKTYLELDVVRATENAVVEIYDYRLGEQGAVLGTKAVNAGANANVKVNLGTEAKGDVIAVLKSGDRVLATQQIDLTRD